MIFFKIQSVNDPLLFNSELWIRIHMDPHPFSLLDPEGNGKTTTEKGMEIVIVVFLLKILQTN